MLSSVHILAVGCSIACIIIGIVYPIYQKSSISHGRAQRTNGTVSAGVTLVNPTDTTKSTPNPRYVATSDQGETEKHNNAPTQEKSTSLFVTPTSTIRHPDYTPDALQRRLDERTFKKVEFTQSSTQRARLLDGMYQELVDTSVKSDPYLQRQNTQSACSPLRGHSDPSRI